MEKTPINGTPINSTIYDRTRLNSETIWYIRITRTEITYPDSRFKSIISIKINTVVQFQFGVCRRPKFWYLDFKYLIFFFSTQDWRESETETKIMVMWGERTYQNVKKMAYFLNHIFSLSPLAERSYSWIHTHTHTQICTNIYVNVYTVWTNTLAKRKRSETRFSISCSCCF